MHSMYVGYMEKAIRYSEKALVQVDRLQGKVQTVYVALKDTVKCII